MAISESPRFYKTGESLYAPEIKPDIGVTIVKYLPPTLLTNEGIASWNVGLTAAGIEKITGGIQRRHIAQEHETPFFMAREVINQALQNGTRPDVLLVSTSHPEEFDLALRLDEEFGFNIDPRFRKNIIAACSGIGLGLSFIKMHEHMLKGAHIMLLGAEKYSNRVHDLRTGKGIDRRSRSQILFGDGAYGMDIPNYSTKWGFKIITPPVNGFLHPKYRNAIEMDVDPARIRQGDIYVKVPRSESGKFEMAGQTVYDAVIEAIPPLVLRMLRNNMMKPEDVAWFIFHQGSGIMVDGIKNVLGERFEGKVPVRVADGNLSSASALKVFYELNQEGQLKPGDIAGIFVFGAGLYASSVFVQFGEPKQQKEQTQLVA